MDQQARKDKENKTLGTERWEHVWITKCFLVSNEVIMTFLFTLWQNRP